MQIIGVPPKAYKEHTAHIPTLASKQTKYEEIEVITLQSLAKF